MPDFVCDGASGNDRLKPPGPQFHRFLDNKVRLVFFYRGKQQPYIRHGLKFSEPLADDNPAMFFGNGGNLHFKFAGPAVKTEKSISRSQFHDIGKVMAPALVQIQFPSAVQRRFNI